MPVREAERTNLNSGVSIDPYDYVGEGIFRTVCAGTFVGGSRNNQAAVCKKFKLRFSHLEDEFFRYDKKTTDKAIDLANEWNMVCPDGREILINQGDQFDENGETFLVEPFIRDYTKFTSNSGTIIPNGYGLEAMEAFSHFCYHKSGGSLIVCDLQGRYKSMSTRYNKRTGEREQRSRYELTDLAICSRSRSYGPTDLGEKGIENFFVNHVCNEFCHVGSNRKWARPRDPSRWFDHSTGTSMLSSSYDSSLAVANPARFVLGLDGIMEADYDSDGQMSEDSYW